MSAIVDKIKKLLALAQDRAATPEEAATAAARAAELMEKYRIDESRLVDGDRRHAHATDEFAEEPIGKPTKRMVSWEAYLLQHVAMAYGCEAYRRRKLTIVEVTQGKKKRRRQTMDSSQLTVVGRRSAIDATKYTFAYLAKEIRRLADVGYEGYAVYMKNVGRYPEPIGRWKNAFKLGAVVAIGQRLGTDRKTRQAGYSPTALAVIDDEARLLEEWLKSRGEESKTQIQTPKFTSPSAYVAGAKAAQTVNLGGNAGLGAGRLRLEGRKP